MKRFRAFEVTREAKGIIPRHVIRIVFKFPTLREFHTTVQEARALARALLKAAERSGG